MKQQIKKLICALTILVFPLSSFAEIVGNTDTKAFITKAEFESLKNTFQTQINNYNNSLDNKIDEAISQYLAGMKVEHKQIVELPYSSWEKVSCMNYDIGNIWQSFDFNLAYNYYQDVTAAGSTQWYQGTWGYFNIKRARPNTTYQKVMLCEAGEETSTDPEYVAWDGRALDYRDSIAVSLTANSEKRGMTNNDDSKEHWWFNGYQNCSLYLTYWTRFANGYYTDLSENAATIWQPSVYNRCSITGRPKLSWYASITSYLAKSASTSVELKYIDNKTKEYEHILHFNNLNGIRLCDKDWTHHLTANPTLTRGNLTQSSYSGSWSGNEGNSTQDGATAMAQTAVGGIYKDAYGSNASTEKIPTVGLLSTEYESIKIRQDSRSFKQTVDKTDYIIYQMPTLRDGFLCFAAKKDDTIIWKPVFGNMLVDGAAQDFEVAVMLATSPFGEGTDFTENTDIEWKVQDETGAEQTHNIMYTGTTKTCTFKFVMPRDSVIYCKWWPRDDNIRNNKNWKVDLDLTQCKTYERRIAQ